MITLYVTGIYCTYLSSCELSKKNTSLKSFKIPNSRCATSASVVIVSRHRCLIAYHDCSTIPLPTAPPSLPIAAAAIHCNHAAAVHRDCRCRPQLCHFCIGKDPLPPIVPSIVSPPSHCPSQLLRRPAAHCAAIAHCRCRRPLQFCRRCPP